MSSGSVTHQGHSGPADHFSTKPFFGTTHVLSLYSLVFVNTSSLSSHMIQMYPNTNPTKAGNKDFPSKVMSITVLRDA